MHGTHRYELGPTSPFLRMAEMREATPYSLHGDVVWLDAWGMGGRLRRHSQTWGWIIVFPASVWTSWVRPGSPSVPVVWLLVPPHSVASSPLSHRVFVWLSRQPPVPCLIVSLRRSHRRRGVIQSWMMPTEAAPLATPVVPERRRQRSNFPLQTAQEADWGWMDVAAIARELVKSLMGLDVVAREKDKERTKDKEVGVRRARSQRTLYCHTNA
jgi:hypothetical protein